MTARFLALVLNPTWTLDVHGLGMGLVPPLPGRMWTESVDRD